MDPHQADDRRLRELMDALRPGRDDLSLPEFAPLAERCQRDPQWKLACARAMRLDLAICDAIHDLPVPAGAVDRLLARLQAEESESLAGATRAAASAVPAQQPASSVLPKPIVEAQPTRPSDAASGRTPAGPTGSSTATGSSTSKERPSPITRPWRMLESLEPFSAVAGVVVVGCLLVAAYYFAAPVASYGPEEILQAVQLYAISEEPVVKFLVSQQPPPAEYPPSTDLVVHPSHWWPVSGLLGRSGVAYELHAGGAIATLYVLERDGSWRSSRLVGLQQGPPSQAQSDTGGRALAAWAPAGSPERLVYLLVVEGGPQKYHAFVASSGPLAFVSPLANSAR